MIVRTLATLTVLALPLLALTYPYGAPSGFDGFDGTSCATCHRTPDGDANTNVGTGSVSITAPDVYVAGQPLAITVAVVNTTEAAPGGSGRLQGFQVSVRDASGTPVGSFDLRGSSAIQFADGNTNYVTHTTAGNQQSSWTFDWTPPAGTPPQAVTVYAAANAANGNSSLTGDYIYTAQKALALATAGEPGPDESAVQLGAVSPQPVRGQARARLTLSEPGDVRARLVDGLGRTVRDLARGAYPAGESLLDVDASGLPSGVYFLVVDTPQGRRTGRVVVAR
ncbi:choice-of-anchor V domain-containing protein [Rubricoccus marinus]|uniref:Reelin domain-containing protein n=1 Tax=Rubricoccus marinus TaxID=716817 RepID=A0A259TVN1_9BACT|nr:choice-of-anchor V domain-containing protein [Rubricoccus marinus]OZC01634.1 hypothetical protein BSZ36_00735 [Rubricoccus marinus]